MSSSVSLVGDELKAASDSAALLQIVKYVNVAAFTIMIFDYFVTFERELVLVWRTKWGLGKILFLLSRYSAFFDVPLVLYYSLAPDVPLDQCLPVYSVASWSTAFGIGMAEAILLLRTYALWGGNRKILVGLSTLYVMIYIPVIVILVIFLRSLRYGPPVLPIVTGCHPTEGSNILFADFALLMLNETVVMVLTLWIGIRNYRHSPNPLVFILYRDGILYFVYIFLISLGNVVVLVAGPPEFVDLLNTFQRVMHSLLSTRIMLHVRAGSQSAPSAPTVSQLRFGSAVNKLKARVVGFGSSASAAGTSEGTADSSELGTFRTNQTQPEGLGP